MTEFAPFSKSRAIALPSLTAYARPRVQAAAGVIAVVALTFLFRLLLVFRYRFDSDETQHLHVAWAWAHGLVQYRDVFDNHMPLFHLLFAPLVRVAGETPSTLVVARLSMLPFFALMAWLTYRIASVCLPQRIAIAATVVGCFAPDFFLCSIEFRTDVLWAASWLVSVAILVCLPVNRMSAFAAGLGLGVAGATSAKTSLLAASLAGAAVITILMTHVPARRVASLATIFAVGAVAPIAIVGALYAASGSWDAFIYCTVLHNVVASDHPARLLLVPVAVALISIGARSIVRQALDIAVIRRRLLVFLTASIYGAALLAFWPIIEIEHWLPFYPLAAAGFAPFVLERERPRAAFAVLTAELLWMLHLSTPWTDHATASLALIQDAMRLTSPQERVVDLKGEFAFRQRASYRVFEKLTRRAIAEGRLDDPVRDDVLRTHAMMALPDSVSFPVLGRAFLRRNFISLGCLRVAGKMIASDRPFNLEVPGEYILIAERGSVSADIDGTRYTGPRLLSSGKHTMHAIGSETGRVALMWARAGATGLTPFAPDSRCDDAPFRIEERRAR